MYTQIGIDLGTMGATVSVPGVGILSHERTHECPAVSTLPDAGDATALKRAIAEEGAVPPIFRDSIIAPEYTAAIIKRVLARADVASDAAILFSVPCNFGEIEESALTEMALQAGACVAQLLYSPLAALVGNNLDPGMGAIVIDIGAARTDILVLGHGRILYKKTCRIGGIDFDEAIVRYVEREHKVRISRETAETVKKKIGTVWVGNEKRAIEVSGQDIKNGEFCTVRIMSMEMFAALEEPTATLMEGICTAITRIPTDLVREVFDTGILLAGGASQLEGIDRMISGVTGVNATCMDDPMCTVARGLSLLAGRGSIGASEGVNISKYIIKDAYEGVGRK